ncbi:MAG: glycosyltransferase [Microgenomates group bacterium]
MNIKKIFRIILIKISPSYKKILAITNKIDLLEKNLNNIYINTNNQNKNLNKFKESKSLLCPKIEYIFKKSRILQKRKDPVTNKIINRVAVKLENLTTKINPVILVNSKKNKEKTVSIICLIYKSTTFADAVYDSLYKHTPKLSSGEAELLFVANDPTKKVIDHLKKKKYNFIINNNPFLSKETLYMRGYGAPEYISRVYRGYNYGIENCKSDIVVLVNSDNMFSPKWLENLLDKLSENRIVTSQLVERNHPIYGVFPKAILGEFGSNPHNYSEEKFLFFAKKISVNKTAKGGGYMPCIVHKRNLEKVGLYPHGNIAGRSFEDIHMYGDEKLYEKLAAIGVKHFTSCDSIVYHFKEGEKED